MIRTDWRLVCDRVCRERNEAVDLLKRVLQDDSQVLDEIEDFLKERGEYPKQVAFRYRREA